LRNRKGTVYEGGIRVPFFIRYKGHIEAEKKIDIPAAHIDITPTILGLVNVRAPESVKMDGRNLVPQLLGQLGEWKDRTLFFQWHRGDVPEFGRAFAARGPRYKLVQAAGVAPGEFKRKNELFDITNDPYEEKDLAREKPEIVEELGRQYEAWFKDMKSTRNFEGPRIHLGSDKENPTVLTRQDWRGEKVGWGADSEGHWDCYVEQAGTYRATVEFEAAKAERKLKVAMALDSGDVKVPAGQTRATVTIKTRRGQAEVDAWFDEFERRGIKSIEVERVKE
jgi:arylsulfatase A-like enzyme